MTQVGVAAGLALAAAVLARLAGLGVERDLLVAALRAAVQLAVVGLLVALVFEHAGLAAAFVAVMLCTASLTSARRLRAVQGSLRRSAVAITAGATAGAAPLLLSGAFSTTPRELIPITGILIGGAMAATSVTGRRLVEALRTEVPAIETRLALGDAVDEAVAPLVRSAAGTGLTAIIDQTRTVGLVTLPGTFVGLMLGGASPAEAARVQLTVLLALLLVQVVATLAICRLVVGAVRRPGERVEVPAGV